MKTNRNMKIVVFDLDETLGYFTQFSIFWDWLNNYFQVNNTHKLTQNDFNNLLDLYPEFLRPNIINILNYLKNKKNSRCCFKVMIYTNNTGAQEWARYIINYFETKIGCKIIDQIIAAFRISNKRIELCRTTHDKTYNDLLRCTNIPLSTEICFIDDKYFPQMINNKIYYINIKPYYYDLTFEEIFRRFHEKKILKNYITNYDKLQLQFMRNIKSYNYKYLEKEKTEYEVDKILGKQILLHLKEFFTNKPNK